MNETFLSSILSWSYDLVWMIFSPKAQNLILFLKHSNVVFSCDSFWSYSTCSRLILLNLTSVLVPKQKWTSVLGLEAVNMVLVRISFYYLLLVSREKSYIFNNITLLRSECAHSIPMISHSTNFYSYVCVYAFVF